MDSPKTASGRLTAGTIDESLAVVQSIFRQFRPTILERAGKVPFTDKSDGSPITDTDMEVEVALKAEMALRYPGMRVYGEETGYDDGLTGAFWLIDPIDGTASFIENIPAFTSMAVLIQDGEAVASIIYNLSLDDMYIAQKGGGAYKNGVRLDLTSMPLPHVAYCKERFFEALNAILKSKRVRCENGPVGAGNIFTMVADGRAAARFNLLGQGYTHDYAPGALLVREAGGAIVPIEEGVYSYKSRSFVACHPDLEETLRPHVREIRALESGMRGKG